VITTKRERKRIDRERERKRQREKKLPNYSNSKPLYAMCLLISTFSKYLILAKDKPYKCHRLPIHKRG